MSDARRAEHAALLAQLPPLWSVRPELLGNPAGWSVTHVHGVLAYVTIYDEVRQVGAMLALGDGTWRSWTPVSRSDFDARVHAIAQTTADAVSPERTTQ
ncbi:MAG: hypothetical protein R3F58_09385 [Steroidobacteraceae bacterium]